MGEATLTVTISGDPEQVYLKARQFFGMDGVQITHDTKTAESMAKSLKSAAKEVAKEPTPAPITTPSEEVPAKQTAAPTGDLAAAIQIVVPRVGKEKGRQGAVELLAKYGAKNGKEIKPADQAAFLAEANALLPEAMRVAV